MKSQFCTDYRTPLFIAALLTIAKIQKQSKCLLTDEWIKTKSYTYIFNDSVSSNDTDFITGSDLNSILSNYYNREEIDEMIGNISVPEIDIENLATKDDINSVKSQITDVSVAISDIQKTVDTKADASTVYTREEANDAFAPSSVTEQISDISTKLENKVDMSEINNIVEEAISNSDTVESAVQDAIDNADIDQKVSDAVDNLDIVTKENLTAEVTTQIEKNEIIIELQNTVEKLVDASIYDGTELPEWDLEE